MSATDRQAAGRHGRRSCCSSPRSCSPCSSSRRSTWPTATSAATPRQAAIKAETHKLGYDRPIVVQYLRYVGDLVHGNLQMSLRTRRPVATDLRAYLPATLELAFFGLVLAAVLGGILGLVTAARFRGSGIFRLVMLAGASTPAVPAGPVRDPALLPPPPLAAGDRADQPGQPSDRPDRPAHRRHPPARQLAWVRRRRRPSDPARRLCIAILPAVSIGRVFRSSLVIDLRTDYVRTARSKGLKEIAVLWHHAIRNSLGAALSMGGLQVGLMFAGVVVIESIFAWPGIGLYTVESIPRADFPAIAGVTLVLGAGYVIVNTVVDILQAVADPRIAL